MTACAIGREATLTLVIQDRFSHDRARRVAGAEEQNVVMIGHLVIPLFL